MLADIPGLIEGAAGGAGLGHEFLAHVERCRVLVHLVDVRAGGDPPAAYEAVAGRAGRLRRRARARCRSWSCCPSATWCPTTRRRRAVAEWSDRWAATRRGRGRRLVGDRRRAGRAARRRSSSAVPAEAEPGAGGRGGRARVRGRAHHLPARRRPGLRRRAQRATACSGSPGAGSRCWSRATTSEPRGARLPRAAAARDRRDRRARARRVRARRRGPDRRGGVRAPPWRGSSRPSPTLRRR